MNYPVVRFISRASLALLLVLSLIIAVNGYGQTVLTISGEVTKPLTLQAADLKAIPHTDVTGTDRDGKEHRYSGVPLAELLKRAGTTLGGELRGENLMKFVVVRAIDGYEVLVMAFVAPHVARAWSLGPVEVGYLLSAGIFGMAIGATFLSPLADRIGRRRHIVLCLSLIVIGMVLPIFSLQDQIK